MTINRLSAALLALALGTVNALATDGVWTTNASANWSATANWSGGIVADGVGATGTFQQALSSSNKNITLDSNRTLGTWNLGHSGRSLNFVPSGGSVLTLDNTGSANVQINVANGGQNIAAGTMPIELMDSVDIVSVLVNGKSLALGTITVKSGASNSGNLTITNNSVGGGSPTTVFGGAISDGAGTISLEQKTAGFSNLGVANTFSGSTTASGGILRLDNALALQNSPLNTTGSATGNATNGLQINTGVTALTLGGLTGNKNFAATGGVFTSAVANGNYNLITALTLNPGTGKSYSYSGAIANGAANMTLTKTGAGTQILTGTNLYTGATNVNAGTLKLGAGGSLDALTSVSIAAGATLDLTELTNSATYTWNTSSLSAKGTATAATITGTALGTIDMGIKPISLTWAGASSGTDNTHPCLTVTGANLSLGGNQVTVVVPGTALDAGVYTLVSAASISGGSTVNAAASYIGGSAYGCAVCKSQGHRGPFAERSEFGRAGRNG